MDCLPNPTLEEREESIKQWEKRGKEITALAMIFYPLLMLLCFPFFYLREGAILPVGYITGKISVLHQILAGCAFGLVVVVVSVLGDLFADSVRKAEREMALMLGRLDVCQALIIALCSAAGEELVFRGLLQPILGIWITSIIFALLHPPPSKYIWYYPLFVFIASLGLGWLFIFTGSGLLAPFVGHCIVNFINLMRLSRRKELF